MIMDKNPITFFLISRTITNILCLRSSFLNWINCMNIGSLWFKTIKIHDVYLSMSIHIISIGYFEIINKFNQFDVIVSKSADKSALQCLKNCKMCLWYKSHRHPLMFIYCKGIKRFCRLTVQRHIWGRFAHFLKMTVEDITCAQVALYIR